MSRPFTSPEAALRFAYGMRELRLEPKNATQGAIDAMLRAAGMVKERPPSDLTPCEHLARATQIVMLVDRVLAAEPLLLAVVRAEFSARTEGALAVQAISEHVQPSLSGGDRILADWLVMRQLRKVPTLRRLSDLMDLSPATLMRRERAWQEPVGKLRRRAIEVLTGPMEQAGVTLATAAA